MLKKFRNKHGDLEWDQIGKVLIALAILIVLIYLVTQVIGGELGEQGKKVGDAFSFF